MKQINAKTEKDNPNISQKHTTHTCVEKNNVTYHTHRQITFVARTAAAAAGTVLLAAVAEVVGELPARGVGAAEPGSSLT